MENSTHIKGRNRNPGRGSLFYGNLIREKNTFVFFLIESL